MGVKLTNVQKARETLGRHRITKVGAFDQMTCTLIGPQAKKDVWRPAIGAPHDEYPLMIVSDVNDGEQEGALLAIQVVYQGFALINGIKPVVAYSMSSSETSASVQMPARQVVSSGVSQVTGFIVNGVYVHETELSVVSFGSSPDIIPMYGQVGKVTRYGWATLTINYISNAVTAKYPSIKKPTGPSNPGGFNAGANIEIISVITGQVSGQEQTTDATGSVPTGSDILNWPGGGDWSQLTATHIPHAGLPPAGVATPQLMCTSFNAEMVAGSYYNCSETWELKFLDFSHLG